MQGRDRLLSDRLEGNRADRFVAQRLEQSLGVGAIGFVARHVRSNGVGREKQDAVTGGNGLSTPMVRHAAGFHNDGGGLAAPEKARKLGSREAVPFGDPAGLLRHRDFQNGFRNVDGNGGRLHEGLLPFRWFAPLATLAQRCRISRGGSPFHHLKPTVSHVTSLAMERKRRATRPAA